MAHVPDVIYGNRDFRHTPEGTRRVYNRTVKCSKWLLAAVVTTWVVSGLYPIGMIVQRQFSWWPSGVWLAAFSLYGVAMALFLSMPPRTRGGYFPHLLALIQSVTALLVHYISATYLGGTGITLGLLVIIAGEVPFILRPAGVWTWVAVQTFFLTAAFAPILGRTGLLNVLGLVVATGAFQMFAAASSMLLRSERDSRKRLAAAHAELLTTRGLLAENSRAEERLRISRDLHDTLGHHLTALSLQLDVAARLSEGKVSEHVRQAHAITRLLLADVRDVVGSLREEGSVEVVQAIRAMTLEQTDVTIHLDLPDVLVVRDRDRADTLIRCVQEIITNSIRHSFARNLWIRLERPADGVYIDARDDGRGATSIDHGHGLTGMRERFERNAGRVDFNWEPGAGFQVRGFLPMPAGT